MKKPILSVASLCLLLTFPVSAHAFSFSFEWGNIKLCTSGRPNRVKNPLFSLRSVPDGTARIEFNMKDLNVPSYRHGGGRVRYSGQSQIEPGAFRYKSPCPPDGSHTYQWTATAKDRSGNVLATATAQRSYP